MVTLNAYAPLEAISQRQLQAEYTEYLNERIRVLAGSIDEAAGRNDMMQTARASARALRS